jgi:hypothetical protein
MHSATKALVWLSQQCRTISVRPQDLQLQPPLLTGKTEICPGAKTAGEAGLPGGREIDVRTSHDGKTQALNGKRNGPRMMVLREEAAIPLSSEATEIITGPDRGLEVHLCESVLP